jgi:hypothetical protein
VVRLPGEAPSSAFFGFLVFARDPCGATLTGLGLSVAGARASRPRQIRRLRSDERRAPPAPGAVRRLRRARRRRRTPDSWLSYQAVALRDQLQECERQDAACPSTLERVCKALIDRDEALRQARADLERMRTLASNWEVEVAAVRNDNLELHSLLREAQAQQSQAEERVRAAEQRAKEADELKATLDAKVAALAIAEDRLLQERTARQGPRGSSSRSRLLLPTPGRRSSRSASLARRRKSRWRGGTQSSRNSRANWWCSASRARARSWPSRSRARPSAASSRRLRPSAAPSRWRRSRSRVSRCLSFVLLIFP